MDGSEYEEFKIILEPLTIDEIAQIPNVVCKKLNSYFSIKIEEFITAKAIYETNRQNLDHKVKELTKDHQVQTDEYKNCQEKLAFTENYLSELQSQLGESRTELYKLQDVIRRLETENDEIRKSKDDLNDENNTLHSQIERKNTELERLRAELNLLGAQLQTAVAAKCKTFSEIEEMRSREMSIDFREKRLDQERILLSQQISCLEEELTKRTAELQNVRSEASASTLLTQTRLSQCEEELKITNNSMIQIRESNAILQRRCEELTQKLDEQRNQELTMHTSYQEEITAQTRLADLYKGMAEEADAKANEYSNAVKELQELLEQATEQYGLLESKYNQIGLDHNKEIVDKDNCIKKLAKELELANDLLKSIKQERLDQAIEQLAPTAAIASKILKKGLSLTQIYTQLVDVTNELSVEKEEKDKLKFQMEIILKELEEKAPVLQQQRLDYESAVDNVSSLSLRIDELLTENSQLHEKSDEAQRLINHHTRENQRLKSELSDLARQVCYLLKEVEECRTGNDVPMNELNSMEPDDLASSRIISKKLVTFKDIEHMQENNQKLLSIVRSLSARQEEIEKATDEIYSGQMKEKLDRYIEQLSDMQVAQDRQTKMLEGLLKQRDMYKNLYHQAMSKSATASLINNSYDSKKTDAAYEMIECSKSSDSNTTQNNLVYQEKLKESEMKHTQLCHEFELYKKEKSAHEILLNHEFERLRKESEKNSANSCKLKAQLDSANDRFHLLQGNVVTYKSQIKILEEKCMNYSSTIGKHEQTLIILKNEALSAQSRLSKAEVQLENLRQEKQLLRDSEGRLLKEREVMQRERHTHALLKADVESIKASLERSQAEGLLRAEQRLDDASRECAALRRRLQEEQDRFRELTIALERQVSKAESKIKEEKSLTARIQDELQAARLSEQDCMKRIMELNSKLANVSTHNMSQTITGDDNSTRKLKDLEIQLCSHQAEIKSLSDQLKASRYQCQQYCDIAESAETQLRHTNELHIATKEDLENKLKLSQDETETLKSKVKYLEDELKNVSTGQEISGLELKKKLQGADEKLKEFDQLQCELKTAKEDLRAATIALAESENKYTKEMVLHSADLQMLSKLKDENQSLIQKLLDLTQQKDSVNEALVTEKSMWQDRERHFQDEIKELHKRVKDLDDQNILLHNQIQELSERTAIMQSQQQTNIGDHANPNTSIESIHKSFCDENSKSAEQLLQVMKYLRREKDLAIAKLDVLKSENVRLKSQIENADKRIKNLNDTLVHERENNDITVLTVSKHSELLRKVETLNAITDSNRILREERDTLTNKIKDLTEKLKSLSNEVSPLREKLRDLEAKNETFMQENASLKAEAMRWRQRANTLVERANRASPEDWRRLQTERENLSKLLTSERETHANLIEVHNTLKSEKLNLEEQLNQLQRQLQSQEEKISKIIEDDKKMKLDLNDSITESNEKSKDIVNLKKDLTDKEAMLSDLKNKEIQIRKIAKKYKTQYEELARNLEVEKSQIDDRQHQHIVASKVANEDMAQLSQEKESPVQEEVHPEHKQLNSQLKLKVNELNQQILIMQSESESLKKEIEIINKASLEKEERAKQVLKGARTKIMQLTEYKKQYEKEMNDLKIKLDSCTNECDSNVSEYEARLAALKSQMEGRILRLEHERADLQAEKDALLQRITQLQRQLSGQSNIGISVSEPPTANIKPMSARAETPLASIRPMSVVVQSRTAAVLPTTVGAPLHLVPQQSQQQLVHTTETSSPTSSLVDYQPASTSRQLVVQPQLNESAESTQREELEVVESQTLQQQQQQQSQQQTVALVIPRVEQHQTQPPLNLPADQQQTVPSSSTQSVTTSHPPSSHKRPRESTALGSNCENADHTRQEQITSPNTKRSRQQEVSPSAAASASEIEYQVPTSSQRDQDEEGEDSCIILDCDDSVPHQTQDEEEFDNDPYEEMEEDLAYGVEVDNNEVEIIMEEESASVEIPRQIQSGHSLNQPQSETISSAGSTAETSCFTSRSRGVAPMPRQAPQQHLLLPQQGYEDAGDDCIVPSTPTLFVPRRSDGFGEAVNSPQVPQARFTFGDPSTSTPVSSVQSLSTSSITGTRSMFNNAASGLVQVMQEGMDDTRIDLTQLEDDSTGRSVPTTPQQVSPCTDQAASVTSCPVDERSGGSIPPLTESQKHIEENSNEHTMPTITIDHPDHIDQPEEPTENIPDSEIRSISEVNQGEVDAEPNNIDIPGSANVEDIIDVNLGTSNNATNQIVDQDSAEAYREAEASPSSNTRQKAMAAAATACGSSVLTVRGATARRSGRNSFRAARGTRPTPIVWDNQSSIRGQNILRGHNPRGTANESTRIRGGRGRRTRSKYPYNY